MKKALKELKKKISKIKKPKKVTDKVWEEFLGKATVVLMAGGESSRFSEVTKGEAVNKNAFCLPNGDSMIEMTIRMYREAGFDDFVALVYHNAKSIENILGDGSKLGVNIRYSYDPEMPVGKGGAIKNAILNGSIKSDRYIIIHNPDDVIVDFAGNFPRHIIHGHHETMNKKGLATVVVVEETPYTFTGMKIKDNRVEQIEMYPQIPIPTHIGVTILSPQAYPFFDKYFDLTKKSDFESVLFPILSRKGLLGAVSIPANCWIAVNNAKSYKELLKRLKE
ncbi:MAG: NDP-sugar synthase [Patescibacteria group bacterium]|nr:NDP-sugar synthase [Patescibacteria group bacterium]